jgi:primase-polymerase (primpol)-like protein
LTSVTITNYDAKTNEIISGNAFSIYDESGKMIRKNFVTDENGVLNFEFEEGKYYVKQAKVIDGYSIMGGTICFNVKNGSEVNLNIYNMPTEETKEVINKSTSQINVTEETKNIEENDVEDITNIKTTNIVKELTKQTNITNFANNNYITNTTYKKNINNVSQNNKYDNSIWVESLNSYTVDGKSETSNMTREEYMTYIDFITSANAEVPSLPSAVK